MSLRPTIEVEVAGEPLDGDGGRFEGDGGIGVACMMRTMMMRLSMRSMTQMARMSLGSSRLLTLTSNSTLLMCLLVLIG